MIYSVGTAPLLIIFSEVFSSTGGISSISGIQAEFKKLEELEGKHINMQDYVSTHCGRTIGGMLKELKNIVNESEFGLQDITKLEELHNNLEFIKKCSRPSKKFSDKFLTSNSLALKKGYTKPTSKVTHTNTIIYFIIIIFLLFDKLAYH